MQSKVLLELMPFDELRGYGCIILNPGKAGVGMFVVTISQVEACFKQQGSRACEP